MSDAVRRPHRRDVLKGLGALGAAATLPACAPTEDASATDDTSDETQDPRTAITHVLVLMMENRTFDHYLGALSLVEGRTDVDGLTADMSNPDADGDPVVVFPMDAECLEDPPHGWDSSRAQLADGTNQGFVITHQGGRTEASRETMGYYVRADLPVFYALADHYAVCDRWFSSVLSSTWPNRIYSLTGTSKGMRSNDFGRVPFTHRSIFGQLDAAGVSWGVYYVDAPFSTLIEEVGGIGGGKLRTIEELWLDLENGRLPQVVFIEPGFTLNDDHPPHAPMLGQLFVSTVYQALAASPYWDSSMLVVNYDEHGGFFDHVVPPKTEDADADQGFDQLGFRVPALVVGPYARAEAIHTQYDHTSVLKHLQQMFDLPPLTERTTAARPLWDCLDEERMARREPRAPVAMPVIDVGPEDFDAACFGVAAHPGQEELFALFDAGVLDPRLDRREEADAILARLLAKAEKLGVARIRR